MDRSPQQAYRDKLRDPRWQKKRLKILERDNWQCQSCGDTETELQIHHLMYKGDPWDVPDLMLKTLCVDCHKHITDVTIEAEQDLIMALRNIGIHHAGFTALAEEITYHRAYFIHLCLDYPEIAVPLLHGIFALLPENWRDIWPYITNAMAALPQERLDELKPAFHKYPIQLPGDSS